MACTVLAPVIDLDRERLRRLEHDLSHIQKWARSEGRRSRVEERWLAMRAHMAAHDDPRAEGFRVRLRIREGVEGAFDELDAHLQLIRSAALYDGIDPRARYLLLREVVERQREWCADQGACVFLSAAHAFEPEELRTLGRMRALREIGRRLRYVLARHPTLPPQV